jgi:hypothetical protein
MASFNWLKQFHRDTKKNPNYAQKTLAAYALGMKSGGSLLGVRILTGEESCQAAQELDLLPLSGCTFGRDCRCVYRPVMKYEVSETEE